MVKPTVKVTWQGQVLRSLDHAAAEVRKAYEDYDRKVVNKAVTKATRSAIRDVVKPVARELAPEDTGVLLRSVTKIRALPRSRKRKGHGLLSGTDSQTEGKPFYAIFQEFGWRPRNRHTGPYRGADKSRGMIRGLSHVAPNAQPYMRPAIYGQQNEIYNHITKILKQELFR